MRRRNEACEGKERRGVSSNNDALRREKKRNGREGMER